MDILFDKSLQCPYAHLHIPLISSYDKIIDCYPCSISYCNEYCEINDMNDKLIYAMVFLRPQRIRELVSQINIEKFIKIKIGIKKIDFLSYIFDIHYDILKHCKYNGSCIFEELIGYDELPVKSLGSIQKLNKTKYEDLYEIIEIISEHYSTTITPYHLVQIKFSNNIYKLLLDKIQKKVLIDNSIEDSTKKCIYCLKELSQNVLVKLSCECEGYTHKKCLIKYHVMLSKIKSKKCVVCSKTMNVIIEKWYKGVHFPFSNIYQKFEILKYDAQEYTLNMQKNVVLNNNKYIQRKIIIKTQTKEFLVKIYNEHIIIQDEFEQLVYAIFYSHVKNVQELLSNLSINRFKEFKNYCKDNFMFDISTNIIIPIISSHATINIDNEIVELLKKKSLECLDIEVDIKCSLNMGKFVWCRNNLIIEYNKTIYLSPGYYLSEIGKQMIILEIEINLGIKLEHETLFIEFYNNNNQLIGFEDINKNKKIINKKIKIKMEDIGTKLYIIFTSYNKSPQKLNEFNKNNINNTDLYYETITIPQLHTHNTECNICFETVENHNKYITKCSHLYHHKCIWDYLKSSNKLFNISHKCTYLCCNSQKILQLNCPTCRTTITN